MEAFYTDAGVLPRSLLQIQRLRFSVHAWVGAKWSEEILFLVAGAFALLLLAGRWPRLAALASWFFVSSLDARNPLVLNHGDELLRIFLFWSIFVPLSSEAGSSPQGSRTRHLSIFTAGLTLQVCAVYFFSALLKTDPSWSVTGTAISTALSLEQLSTSLGRELLAWPSLLGGVTLGVYYLELLGPLLVFVPWRNRRIREMTIGAFIAVHVGIAATMKLGIFPWVSLLGWVLILPSETLDSVQRFLRWQAPVRTDPAVMDRARGKLLGLTANVFGVYLLCAVIIWNIRGLNLKTQEVIPTSFDIPLLAAQLDQRWNMFAPKPNYVRGWYVAQADLPDGSQVDLMKAGQPFSLQRPDVIASTFPDFRWRKYLINIGLPRFERYRQSLSAFLKRRWNRTHAESQRIERVAVYFIWQDMSIEGDSTVRTTVITKE
jgi:Vitamin K-dependent gamma-carboxylase